MENLEKKLKKELLKIAKQLNIKKRHKMRKKELVEAIKTALKKEEKLLKLSLEEDKFSSHILWEKEEIKEEKNIIYNYPFSFEIPERYDINIVVLLPVDPYKHFVYWMLKTDTLNILKEKHKDFKFLIKLYKEGKETLSFEVYSENGNYYIHHYAPFKRLFVVFGILKENEFIPLMKSNEIVAPSDIVSFEEKEVWLRKEKGKKVFKEIEFSESLSKEMENLIEKFKTIYTRGIK